MDTTPQYKEDQMPLSSLITASNVSITSDDRITTHPTGIYRQMNYAILKINILLLCYFVLGPEIPAGVDQTDRLMRAALVCSSTPVVAGKTAPQPGAQIGATRERSQSLTSISRNPERFKSTSEANSEGRAI